MSVLWPSKYAKIRFSAGATHGAGDGAHDAPPDPLLGWRADTPPHRRGDTLPHMLPQSTRTTFGARHASPQKSSQIYAYESQLPHIQYVSYLPILLLPDASAEFYWTFTSSRRNVCLSTVSLIYVGKNDRILENYSKCTCK